MPEFVPIAHENETYEIVRPSLSLELQYMSLVREFDLHDEYHFVHEDVLERSGFVAYVDWLQRGEKGSLGSEYVPWSAYWLLNSSNGEIVGIASLRHSLNRFMQERGGHVGYRVRPSYRSKGLGKLLLRQMVLMASRRGIGQIMVVCHDDNLASAAVILGCGGVEYEAVPDGDRRLRRFQIDSSV